jgi:hypothetical protein
MVGRRTVSGDLREHVQVEARISAELFRLAQPHRVASRVVPPPAYVRRHLVEHAAAGAVLDEEVLSAAFLPYVDAGRLRAISTSPGVRGGGRRLIDVWRQVAFAWDWNRPEANADALDLWAAAAGLGASSRPFGGGLWRAMWAHWALGSGETLSRRAGSVLAVATATLPDGRVLAVTGSDDGTVRVWDLTTGSPVGDPLIGHTDCPTAEWWRSPPAAIARCGCGT